MHCNELGTFIPSLMSRAMDSTIINILYDQPLVCGNQPIYEDLGKKISLSQQNLRISNGRKVKVLKLGQLAKPMFF